MPLSGGTWTRNYDWTDDRDAGIKIRSDRFDEELDDIAVALSTALYKDGQQVPTANLPMGGFKLTGLGTPTATTDAATKAYVDTAAAPAPRITVRIATTANVNLTTDIDDGSTVDGVAVATGDLILLKNQTNATQNGVYVVPAAAGTAARSTSADTWDEHVGLIIAVTAGTAGADTLWVSMVNSGGTLGSTDITFAPSGASLPTPLPLSLGGLGNALVDPDADRIPFWDDSAGQIAWLAPTTGISITGTALDVTTATTAVAGIIERATDAEAIAGTSTSRAVSPSNITAKIASQAEAEAGTSTTTLMNPLRTAQAIAAIAGTEVARKTANQTVNSASLADVTDLTFAIGANETWDFEATVHGTNGAGAATRSLCYSMNGPASPSSVAFTVMRQDADFTVVSTHTAYEAVDTTSVGTGNTFAIMTGRIVNGSNAGTVAVRVRQAATGSAATVYVNSILKAWQA